MANESRATARRSLTVMERYEQPLNWRRAILSGIVGAILMMGFLDIYFMAGISRFSLEVYIGSMITGDRFGTPTWVAGFLANSLIGGLFGVLYAYFFEFVYRKADVRIGVRLGFAHAILAAVAFFPFFGLLHSQMSTGVSIGFFGSRLEPVTPILLLFAHLLYGMCLGLFYGPVRAARVRQREFEPGETGLAADPDVIRPEEDAEDRAYA